MINQILRYMNMQDTVDVISLGFISDYLSVIYEIEQTDYQLAVWLRLASPNCFGRYSVTSGWNHCFLSINQN